MKQESISKNQLRMLYALWNLYAVEGDDRTERLRWASKNLNREVTSFSNLTRAEAKTLIDIAQVGLEVAP